MAAIPSAWLRKKVPASPVTVGLPPRHLLGDARLPDSDAEFEQFAMNPWSSPQRLARLISRIKSAEYPTAPGSDVIVHGFFVDGVLRGAADLRIFGSLYRREAEAAFSIEKPWQSLGIGAALLERQPARCTQPRRQAPAHLCLVENQRMQQLARKFEAELSFDFGTVDWQGGNPYPDPAVGNAGTRGRRSKLRRRLCQFPIPPVKNQQDGIKIKPSSTLYT